MKKILFVIIVLILACDIAGAQYYNQYGNSYDPQIGYEIGRQAVERAIQQQEAILRNNPDLMLGAMIQAIAGDNDEKAYGYAEYLATHRGSAVDWYWLGVLNEAGIHNYNVEYAKRCYRTGANKANGAACTQRLNELVSGNRVTAQIVRNYCKQASYYASQTSLPDFGTSTTGSSTARNSGSCPRCHGSGIDSSPACVGNPYAGSGAASQGLVGYTHTNGGRCPYCGTYDYHIHYKCYDSTYHPGRR